MEKIENPGSFNEFVAYSGLSGEEALEAYTNSLVDFRESLAQESAVGVGELHYPPHILKSLIEAPEAA